MMKETAHELRTIIHDFTKKLEVISETEFDQKSTPARWSKKEVLGHLIDSAQNNLRRFVCAQYEAEPPHIVYDQDFWVKANNYQQTPAGDVIQLWRLLNLQLATVMETLPTDQYELQVQTSQLYPLSFIGPDYVRHLKHHLNQIFPQAFDVRYP